MIQKEIKLSQKHITALTRKRRIIINYDALDPVKLMGLCHLLKKEQLVESLFNAIDTEGSAIDSV